MARSYFNTLLLRIDSIELLGICLSIFKHTPSLSGQVLSESKCASVGASYVERSGPFCKFTMATAADGTVVAHLLENPVGEPTTKQ